MLEFSIFISDERKEANTIIETIKKLAGHIF